MDCRDRQALEGNWYDGFDERKMVLLVHYVPEDEDDDTGDKLGWYVPDDPDDDKGMIALPARFEVCELCDGRGRHVNPSIDAHGLTAEDFDEDPDFREHYASGCYDVDCYRCHGRRVEPVFDEERATPEQKAFVEQLFADRAADWRERESEMRYGY